MHTRGHLRLPRPLIPALMLLATVDEGGAEPPAAALRELERRGLASRGRVASDAAALVTTMTDARLVVSIECRTADRPHRSTIWARAGDAVWGRPAERDVFELRAIDPMQLPLLVAQITDVGRRPHQPFTGSVTVDSGPLRAALDHAHDPETAFGILVAGGVDPLWADRLLIAHDHRRATWTVSSVWTDPGGHHGVHEATVLDAGPAGYWEITHDDEGIATYTVASSERVMRTARRSVPDWCTSPT